MRFDYSGSYDMVGYRLCTVPCRVRSGNANMGDVKCSITGHSMVLLWSGWSLARLSFFLLNIYASSCRDSLAIYRI